MTEIKRVKIQNIIESQIPEFLNEESPLFQEFLKQYYISQEHQTGVTDLAVNIEKYKNIDNFNNETFFNNFAPSTLTEDVLAFSDTLNVTHTIGFPEKYGLLKIDNEIITYTSKDANHFYGCVRGFSGIHQIRKTTSTGELSFSSTDAEFHKINSKITNLNILFFSELFRKFKSQFLPGFENRNFIPQVKIKNILTRAIDFYTSKGTDTSYKLLFNVLFGENISVIKPQDYLFRPQVDNYFSTKNILVEKITGSDPLDLKGKTLYQEVNGTQASASIYSVEYRPVDGKTLYEIYLDSLSFVSNFSSTKKTNLTERAVEGQKYLIVDSTIGFPESGNLVIKTKNLLNYIIISYSGKTINQFLNVTGVISDLEFADEIFEQNFVFAYDENDQKVEFRLIDVIGNIDYEKTSNIRKNDKIKLSSFGIDLNDNPSFNCWLYNIPTEHEIQTISLSNDVTGRNWTITLYDSNKFYVGQEVTLFNTNDINDVPVTCSIKDIISSRVIEVTTTENIQNKNKLRKNIAKAKSFQNYHSGISSFPIGIQNAYVDKKIENFYITSNSLPNYEILTRQQIINTTTLSSPSGVGKTDIVETDKIHSFYTGEKIYYFSPSNSGISSGIYHVTTIGDPKDSRRIKLSLSKSDLFSEKYVQITSGITSGYFVKVDYEGKILKNEPILKKFSLTKELVQQTDKEDKTTNNRRVGIFVNGVEIYSPTLYDENIYYGKLDAITVTNNGSNYDVINPPELEIVDSSGSGASGYINIVGSISEIKIISPGIGYKDKPKISVIGGNGSGAILEPNLVSSRIISGFRGDSNGVNPSTDTITFINPHNFEDGEQVIYGSNFNAEIPPFKNGSTYYVGVLNDTQVKLFNNRDDAVLKQNQINVAGISSGFQNFSSFFPKNTINKIYVKNPGSGYSNNKVVVPNILSFDNNTNGLNNFDNYIFAKNHNFKEKDIVRYSTTGTIIGGLSTTTQYLVSVIDENKFRLSECGIGTQFSEFNYDIKNYVDISTLGTGKHTFYYPPIEITVEATSGSATTSFINPILKPIVLGSINNVFLEESGVGYGVSDIINFHRRPDVRIKSIESEALLKPIIVNGTIVDVQILTYGSGYLDNVDIIVNGSGKFAHLIPIISNGEISGVNILDGGKGYDRNTTSISIIRRGSDAKFIGDVYEWKINQVEKNYPVLDNDDSGFIVPSIYGETLEYINFYLSKNLRKSLKDHLDDRNREEINNVHSPIVGWAYDGNPIYGPYGQVGNEIRRIRSGYSVEPELNPLLRPGLPEGFFIQDYVFDRAIGDLDEYNGRFCITPEFPKGVYAYFSTVTSDLVSKPQFPYVVSNFFRDNIIKENFDSTFNQDTNFSDLGIIRNIGPYYLNSSRSSYNIINSVDEKYKQEFLVTQTKSGSVEEVNVYNRGDRYKVGEIIEFDNSKTEGSGASAFISDIRGKNISDIEIGITTVTDANFSISGNTVKVTLTTSHNFITGDKIVVSSISTSTYSNLLGQKTIFVRNKSVGLTTNISTVGVTGQTAYIYVNDTSGFDVNDLIKIDSEILQILQIDGNNSRLFVNRLQNTGIHTSGISSVTLLPTSFIFSQDNNFSNIQENTVTYFNPNQAVGFGSTSGTNYTLIDQSILNVPPRSIYIPNHNFSTGQELNYNIGFGGTSISVSNNPSLLPSFQLENDTTVYAINFGRDYVGISTVAFTTSGNALYFIDNRPINGFGHSLTTKYPSISGTVENYSIDVTTTNSHQLETNEIISLNVFPSLTQTVTLRYDLLLRKITTELINFNAFTELDINTSKIYLQNNRFKTGDKVVYYSNGNSNIPGLISNNTYYVIKTDLNNIQLSESYYKANNNQFIELNTLEVGTHSFALINPPLSFTQGNSIVFDLSDSSLTGMDLKLFYDSNLIKEVESFKYSRNFVETGLPGATLTINTNTSSLPNELYYNLIPFSPQEIEKTQISSDDTVIGKNKITLLKTTLNYENKIIKLNSTKFRIPLPLKPDSTSYNVNSGVSTVYYDTKSNLVDGPISKIKVSYGGKSYKILPPVKRIVSENGSNAIVKSFSNSIGKIDYLERVKDGYDYPTDPTLKPYLSVPTVCQIKDIFRVESVGIITGGKNYNTAPRLKVIGNDNIKLTSVIRGGSVVEVKIDQNTNDLKNTLRIIPTRNSNGYDIDDIVYNSVQDTVTLELVNSDNQLYPLISNSYGGTDVVFPFQVGDEIFIENCRVKQDLTNPKINYNSSGYDYRFFTVVGINTVDYTVTYSVADIVGTFGEYITDFNFGFVVNRKDMAEFEMNIIDDLSYISGENVIGYDNSGNQVFSAKVMQNGWDNDINEIRLTDSKGELEPGNKLYGVNSRLNGTVEFVNIFNLFSDTSVSREKFNTFNDGIGILNDFQQRLSDNDYYQKFSYSIKSKISYDQWKEPVRSILHPAGFKEFSDLDVVSVPSNHMKVGIGGSSLQLLINIDNQESVYSRNNFSMVIEDEQLEDGSIERVFFPEGVALKPYILSKTNKVIKIDDISESFTGITSDIGGSIVGVTTFNLRADGIPLFYKQFDSQNEDLIDLELNAFRFTDHNFQSGQKIIYQREGAELIPVGVANTIIDLYFNYDPVSENFDGPIITFDDPSFTFDSN